MLERTIIQIKDAVKRASGRIEEGEALLELLRSAGEDVGEVEVSLTSARARRDQWISALRIHGHMSGHEDA